MVMVTKGHAPGSGTGNWSQMSVHTLEGIWQKPGLPRPETGLPGWLSRLSWPTCPSTTARSTSAAPGTLVNTPASFQTSPRAIHQEQRELSPPPAPWLPFSSLTSRLALPNGDLP